VTGTSGKEVVLASWVHVSDIHFGHGNGDEGGALEAGPGSAPGRRRSRPRGAGSMIDAALRTAGATRNLLSEPATELLFRACESLEGYGVSAEAGRDLAKECGTIGVRTSAPRRPSARARPPNASWTPSAAPRSR